MSLITSIDQSPLPPIHYQRLFLGLAQSQQGPLRGGLGTPGRVPYEQEDMVGNGCQIMPQG